MVNNIYSMIKPYFGESYIRLINENTIRIYNQFGYTDYILRYELCVGKNDDDIVKEILKDYAL